MAAIDDRQTVTRTASKPITGADVLVESLARHGVEVVFAYPGGASMPLHQALTRYRDRIRTILPRHEQGGIFAAEGYARATRQAGRGDGDLRPRGAEPGHRAGRRQDGLGPARRHHRPGSDARHRHRRVPGNADGRGLPGDHQAPLPGLRTPGTSRGSSRRRFTWPAPAGPGPVLIDIPKDVQNTIVADPDYDVADGPARLPAAAAAVAGEDPTRSSPRSGPASGRSSTAAAASSPPTPPKNCASSPPRPASPWP